ncbi:uncharacterized protein DNG_09097 [Cephalotrichum gorgonifer]|uniref:NAD(P)-binding domain-containing protein n=1 Tax=Cephalotrichum gorgonifer TaxID=2041049 RepID=A0AAE8N6W5_9PEZI|nr:uncharacterized protein DNG_09097 [Cephalotrichum gorgonifer]
MTTPVVLVFGGTGPAGICLIRELLHRNHRTRAFARNPDKIPEDLRSNPLLEVIKGEVSDKDALTTAVSGSTVIVSFLGPNTLTGVDPAIFTTFYSTLFPIMREHNVKRIYAMSTISHPQPDDGFSFLRLLLVALVYVAANGAYRTVRGIGRVFTEEAKDLDYTVFRIAGIPGGSDEESWRKDREDGETYVGPIAGKGWSLSQKRGALVRWLVDAVEDGKQEWIRKMPAVSRLAGSKRKSE